MMKIIMSLEFSEKLDLLGAGAAEEVDTSSRRLPGESRVRDGVSQCQTCAANPRAPVVTHRANQPIRAGDILPPSQGGKEGGARPRDLKPWLSSSIRSDGKRISIVKTIDVQSKGFCSIGHV